MTDILDDMQVYKKLHAVQSELTPISKDGKNTFHNYKYARKEDILNIITPLAIKHGLAHYVTVPESTITSDPTLNATTGKTTFNNTATVLVLLKIVDIDTGSYLLSEQWGYAQDTTGDKAIYKATTGAVKYAYINMFGLVTDDDPENDRATQTKHQNQQSAQQAPIKNVKTVLTEIKLIMKENKLDGEDAQRATGFTTLNGVNYEQARQALDNLKKFLERGEIATPEEVNF